MEAATPIYSTLCSLKFIDDAKKEVKPNPAGARHPNRKKRCSTMPANLPDVAEVKMPKLGKTWGTTPTDSLSMLMEYVEPQALSKQLQKTVGKPNAKTIANKLLMQLWEFVFDLASNMPVPQMELFSDLVGWLQEHFSRAGERIYDITPPYIFDTNKGVYSVMWEDGKWYIKKSGCDRRVACSDASRSLKLIIDEPYSRARATLRDETGQKLNVQCVQFFPVKMTVVLPCAIKDVEPTHPPAPTPKKRRTSLLQSALSCPNDAADVASSSRGLPSKGTSDNLESVHDEDASETAHDSVQASVAALIVESVEPVVTANLGSGATGGSASGESNAGDGNLTREAVGGNGADEGSGSGNQASPVNDVNEEEYEPLVELMA